MTSLEVQVLLAWAAHIIIGVTGAVGGGLGSFFR